MDDPTAMEMIQPIAYVYKKFPNFMSFQVSPFFSSGECGDATDICNVLDAAW